MSQRSTEVAGAAAFHTLTRDLWLEFKVASDYSTGVGAVTRGTVVPPSGFVRDDLGFGLDGPDKCSPGCRCNAIRPSRYVGKRPKNPRKGPRRQQLLASAAAAAVAATQAA